MHKCMLTSQAPQQSGFVFREHCEYVGKMQALQLFHGFRFGWLVVSAGWLGRWLVGQLVGWQVDGLVGWLVG